MNGDFIVEALKWFLALLTPLGVILTFVSENFRTFIGNRFQRKKDSLELKSTNIDVIDKITEFKNKQIIDATDEAIRMYNDKLVLKEEKRILEDLIHDMKIKEIKNGEELDSEREARLFIENAHEKCEANIDACEVKIKGYFELLKQNKIDIPNHD